MAKLSVLIGGDDRELQKALKRSQSSLQHFGREMRAGASVAAKWGVMIAAAALTASAAIIKGAMDAIDAQAKLAQQNNTTVASMATLEALSKTSGIAMETMAMAGKALAVRMGEAAQGQGEAAKSMKRLKLTSAELLALPLDERLALINERIFELIPATQRAAVAADLFGSRAAQMMLQLSPEAIRQARKDTEDFGTALSDVDARKVELANDAMSRIGIAVDGITRQIAVQFAPTVLAIAEHFLNAAKASGNFSDHATSAFNKVISAAGFVMDAVDGIKRVFAIVADSIIIGINAAMGAVAIAITETLKLLDKIPGVDFSETIASMESFMHDANGVMTAAMDNIETTLMRPMPSEGLKLFVEEANRAAQAAAEAAVKIDEMRRASGPGEGGEPDEAFEKRLKQIRDRNIVEQELLREHQAVLMDLIRAHNEGKFATEAEWAAVTEEANRQHMERLKQIRERSLTDLQRFNNMSWQAQVKNVSGALTDMTAGVAQHSRTMFNINKQAGIANAIVSAATGIAKTLAAYPFPINIGMAAAHAISAFAQVQAIRSTSFDGGGGGAPSLAGGTPATPVTPVGGSEKATPTQNMTVNLAGGEIFSRSTVIGLIEEFNKAHKDGARLVVTVA